MSLAGRAYLGPWSGYWRSPAQLWSNGLNEVLRVGKAELEAETWVVDTLSFLCSCLKICTNCTNCIFQPSLAAT